MELTREEIEYLATGEMTLNEMRRERGGIPKKNQSRIKQLAKQLIAEMDKPGVWDNAPEWATKAVVNWSAKTHYSGIYHEYTRELPKSPEREIATRVACKHSIVPGSREQLEKIALDAINEYKALRK